MTYHKSISSHQYIAEYIIRTSGIDLCHKRNKSQWKRCLFISPRKDLYPNSKSSVGWWNRNTFSDFCRRRKKKNVSNLHGEWCSAKYLHNNQRFIKINDKKKRKRFWIIGLSSTDENFSFSFLCSSPLYNKI